MECKRAHAAKVVVETSINGEKGQPDRCSAATPRGATGLDGRSCAKTLRAKPYPRGGYRVTSNIPSSPHTQAHASPQASSLLHVPILTRAAYLVTAVLVYSHLQPTEYRPTTVLAFSSPLPAGGLWNCLAPLLGTTSSLEAILAFSTAPPSLLSEAAY